MLADSVTSMIKLIGKLKNKTENVIDVNIVVLIFAFFSKRPTEVKKIIKEFQETIDANQTFDI